jgi:hypothetical protein
VDGFPRQPQPTLLFVHDRFVVQARSHLKLEAMACEDCIDDIS